VSPAGRVLRRTLLLLALAALIGPARASALSASCSPGFNGPGTVAPGTVIAPGLRVVKSSYSIGDCDSTISATARSADGTIWGVDQGGAKNGLWKSTDDLASWQLAYQATGYGSVEEVLPLASGHLLIMVRGTDGIRHILRSTGTDGTAFDPPSLDLPSGALIHDPQSWVQTGGAIYVAEYGDPAPPIVVWKSTDDGQSFQVAFSLSDVRHYHSIQPDPYQAGRLWLDAGDTGTQPRIGFSDNGAASFTWITQTTYPQSRAVDMMLTPDAAYWGSDTPDVPSGLFRWDRQTNAISTVLGNLNGSFYNTFSANNVYAQFSAVELASDGYTGDGYFHVLTSVGGTTWSDTRTPFARTAGDTNETALMTHFTPPDSQGRFWGSLFDVAGTQFKNSNIQFQLDPTAGFSGPAASFTASDTSVAPGQTVSFDGSASSSPHPPLTYDWDFGDGSTATGAQASHSFSAPGTYTVRLQVTDANTDANEQTRTINVAAGPPPPIATTSAASGVSTGGATLNGAVNPQGLDTTVHFEYGTTTAYGSTTPDQGAGSGTSTVNVSAPVSGLSPSTTYHYRIVATSSAGTSRGADATFTTLAAPVAPGVTTNAASNVGYNAATLNGSVNPNGLDTTAQFEYGTTTSYGGTTASQSVGSGSTAVTVSAALSGLVPNTTYHFRIDATNTAGTSLGSDRTFTTGPGPPVVTTGAATSVTSSGARLNGTVNPGGAQTTYWFEYGKTTAYGSKTTRTKAGAGTTDVPASDTTGRLSPGTVYHFRLVATNSSGTTYGQDVQFTTGR
jgi:PKD repeat protein